MCIIVGLEWDMVVVIKFFEVKGIDVWVVIIGVGGKLFVVVIVWGKLVILKVVFIVKVNK